MSDAGLTPKSPIQRDVAALAERIVNARPVYLDTETTGLERRDEIVEISILDSDGSVLLQSTVKPLQPIPAAATRVHGITNADVATSPAWPVLWPKIRSLIFSRTIVAYNAAFDLRMMQQTHTQYRLTWRESFEWFDLMALFSKYRGDWDPLRRSMRLFKLEEAGRYFGISLPNAHRASADSLLTRAVLHTLAGKPY